MEQTTGIKDRYRAGLRGVFTGTARELPIKWAMRADAAAPNLPIHHYVVIKSINSIFIDRH